MACIHQAANVCLPAQRKIHSDNWYVPPPKLSDRFKRRFYSAHLDPLYPLLSGMPYHVCCRCHGDGINHLKKHLQNRAKKFLTRPADKVRSLLLSGFVITDQKRLAPNIRRLKATCADSTSQFGPPVLNGGFTKLSWTMVFNHRSISII